MFLSQEPGYFERPGMAGARAPEPSRSDSGRKLDEVGTSEGHGRDRKGESSSREVSDADEEEAPPLATPQGAAAANDDDFDIPVSDTPDSEDASGSGSGDREPDDDLTDDGIDSDIVPEGVRHYLWAPQTWIGGWRPWFQTRKGEFDNHLIHYEPKSGGLKAADFPRVSHNGGVRREWRATGVDPDSSSESDEGMLLTIGGLAGQVHDVLRDMCWAGEERVIAYCEQLILPTLAQTLEIKHLAEKFLREWDNENALRGYTMLRPSEVICARGRRWPSSRSTRAQIRSGGH